MNQIQTKAIRNLILNCGSLQARDRVLIVCDSETRSLAEAFCKISHEACENITLIEMHSLNNHGDEPSEDVAFSMLAATLIISLCKYSLAHSNARIKAGLAGARFLSLPLYDWNLLKHRSLHIDFKSQASIVKKVTEIFTQGKKIHVTTRAGTDLSLDITDRIGNYCPGFVENAGDLGSPPDIESNISPIEDASNGVVVVDGSITHPLLGLLDSPITLDIKCGQIAAFHGKNKRDLSILNQLFSPENPLRRILAECGVGLNPAAELTGTMLTDEGALGCVHFGFGSNFTVGGKNKVDFHLDFVFREASLEVDGQVVLKNGDLQL